MADKFWLVWNGQRHGTPTVAHSSPETAKAEAERLTRQHGGRFHVLELIASVERTDVQWTHFEQAGKGDDGIPF